jgi:hypothetical protein
MDTIKSCTNCMYFSTNKHGFWEPRCIDCGDESTADNPYPLWASSYPYKVEAGKPSDWENDSDDMCPNCVTPYKCNGPHNETKKYKVEVNWKPLLKAEEDAVNHPRHYTDHPSGVECIQITEHMNFCLGNAIKYIWRAGLKSDSPIEDLKKARWYVDRELQKLGAE